MRHYRRDGPGDLGEPESLAGARMLRAIFAVLLPRLLVLTSLLIHSGVVVALRMTSLQIPQHALLNTTVHMQCNFDLDEERLYSVKWYKDGHEFYRYVPSDAPQVLTFPVPGVNVNPRDSSQSLVVLNNVNLTSSGRYRCEVSAEAPAFQTVSDHADMFVVVLPNEGPQITGGRSKYQVGDVVRMNCTSAPSQPAAQLSWYINDELADTNYLIGPHEVVTDENDLEIVLLGLEFRVANKHFRRGDMKLKCLAKVATVYLQSNEESAEGDESFLKTPIMESRETRAQSHTREDLTNESASVGSAHVWTTLLVVLATWIALAR